MPHMPDSQHDTHDLELVAAFAAGDAEGPALDRALALVAACGDCADLHRDLRAIASAMPSMPPAVRPRDFRLTAEQAASLRPSGLRGLIASLSGPRFSFAVPLGSGLAALGIVAVLVAPGAGGVATAPAASGDTATRIEQEAAPSALDTMNAAGGEAASGAPVIEAPAEGVGAGDTGPAEGAQPAGGGIESTGPAVLKTDDGTTAGAPDGPAFAVPETPVSDSPSPLVAGGVALVFLGFALVGARLVSRRLARAP